MVESVIKNMTPKTVRMSRVALSAAVMAVAWAIIDELAKVAISPIIVSSITALVMLIAQFLDFKARAGGDEVFEGEPDE